MFELKPEGRGGGSQAVQMGKGFQVQGSRIQEGQRLERKSEQEEMVGRLAKAGGQRLCYLHGGVWSG